MFALQLAAILWIFNHDSSASVACPSTSPPNSTLLKKYHISLNYNSDIPVYSLSPTNASNSRIFRFSNTSSDSACGNACLSRLYTFYNGLTYYVASDPIPPLGFVSVNGEPLFCVKRQGDCNAWIPLWREISLRDDGIHYAYSIGYENAWTTFKEPSPLCYVWTLQARPRSQNCTASSPNITDLAPLRVYDNAFGSTYRDHLYTTIPPPPEYRYPVNQTTGYVVTDDNSTDCGCLIPLIQVYAYNQYIMPHRDHKWVSPAAFTRSANLEKYEPTGEQIFCATQYGACGATVPLRQYYSYVHMDTTYGFSNYPNVEITRVPKAPSLLCYVWSG